MKRQALEERALASIQRSKKLREVMLVHSAEAVDPESGDTIYEFVAVSADDPNGPPYRVILDEDGKSRKTMPQPAEIERHGSTPHVVPGTAPAGAIAIQPDTNILTL